VEASIGPGGECVAARADTPCPADSLCFYQDRDFGEYMIAFPAGSVVPSLNDYLCLDCNSSKHPGSSFHPAPCPEY
jgi:hypothetical protein